jgi:hypothetical protein
MSTTPFENRDDGIPVFSCEPYRITQWRFKCPKCRQYHYHGAPGGDGAGHRSSHCDKPGAFPRGYILELARSE